LWASRSLRFSADRLLQVARQQDKILIVSPFLYRLSTINLQPVLLAHWQQLACMATDNSSSYPEWSRLPADALALILQLTNQKQRLASCALVHSSWHAAAAVAATNSMSADLSNADSSRRSSLQAFLAAHARTLTKIDVTSCHDTDQQAPDFSQLPCAKLRSLRLEHCSIRKNSPRQPGTLQHAKQLQQLSLLRCLTDDLSTLQQQLPGSLQDVLLESIFPAGAAGASTQFPPLHAGLLQALARCADLTSLALHQGTSDYGQIPLQHLSNLSTLRSLSLKWPTDRPDRATAFALTGVSALSQLTSFTLHLGYTTPGIVPWVGLQSLLRLDLAQGMGLDLPAELVSVGQLTQLQYLRVTNTQSIQALLAVLPRLKQLTHLSLEVHPMFYPIPAGAFSTMTASSNLRQLNLHHHLCLARLGPVWDHMLPAGRIFSQLIALTAYCNSTLPLGRLAQSCPNLQELMFLIRPAHNSRGLFAGRHAVTALSQLQALTRLELRGTDYHAVSSGVAQLTGMRQLSIRSLELLAPADVVSLAQLKGLTGLECRHIKHDRLCEQHRGIACQLPAEGLLKLDNQVRLWGGLSKR
jgi:hypothetical protein